MTDVAGWLEGFAARLSAGDGAGVAQCFRPDGLWRDVLAFGWTIATHEGEAAIARLAGDRAPTVAAGGWATDAPAGARAGFITFSTAVGRCRGYVRLSEGKAQSLLTSLEDLAGHEFPVGPHRPSGKAEARDEAPAEQPYVVIVGAGQSGLALGAALRLLGVPAVLVDRHPRVGDQWRSRYKSLTLHDPVWYDHMPFLPFPDHWPVYTPKDRMGDWLEHYAAIMELDVWCSTECLGARHDAASGRWEVKLRRGGKNVVLRPAQVVMALGNAGFPRLPDFPGQERFAGRQCHSSQHPGSEGLAGKRVVVVGANNSALDIAEDAVLGGAAAVTMIQRSSTHIFHQASMRQRIGPLYSEEAVAAGVTTDKADYINLSMPIRLQEKAARRMWDDIREKEADYYARIEAAGFRLDFGVDGTGMQMKYLRAASGYYIDVGATDLIVEGRIRIQPGEVREVAEDGIFMEDGTHLPADDIVYATGFGAMEEWVERLIGKDVADRLGRCWGYGSGTRGDPGPWEGEIRNMWKPTAQEGLWFMGGNLAQVRTFARYLALQLKARFEGIDAAPYQP